MFRCVLVVAVLMGLLFVSTSSVMAKEKEKGGRGFVQSVDFTAKSFVVKTQGKTNVTLTLKYTDTTKFELDKAASKAEDVLKEKALVRFTLDSTNEDTTTRVTGVTETPKKDGEKKDGEKKE